MNCIIKEIEINGKIYKVFLTKKHIKNINFRYNGNDFIVSLPILCSYNYALDVVKSNGFRLINRFKKNTLDLITEEYVYFFGEKKYWDYFKNNEELQRFSSFDTFYKNVKKYFLSYLTTRVKYYENLMNIKDLYKVRVRDTKTRYGSNSNRTMSLSFALTLVHYDKDIIDSVIVHELAHHFEHNHGKHFYSIILQYCPNYYELDKKLRRNIFND